MTIISGACCVFTIVKFTYICYGSNLFLFILLLKARPRCSNGVKWNDNEAVLIGGLR